MHVPYCPDCPRRYRPIPGDGPQPADVLIVGERPGANENKYQRVFIGKTGQELNETYLPLAGWKRTDVRVCNAVRCWADNNRTPTDREVASCSRHHLPLELDKTKPEIVILMGGSACKVAKGIKLDTHHGIPQHGRIFGWEGCIVPMYHPALGLHESKWMTQILEDWEELPQRLADYAVTGGQPEPYETDYRAVTGAVGVNRYFEDHGRDGVPLGIDTEDHGGVPFSVQVSVKPGTGAFIGAEDQDALQTLNFYLGHFWDFMPILHYAVHDLDVLARMGVEPTRFRDTMQEAYHLGSLPQGLKPLVYRLFGHTMTSWEDVVRPYSIEALTEWMIEAKDVSAADLSLIEVKKLKTKVKETVKRGPLEQLIDRLIQHTDVASDYDPWQRLDEFWQEEANEWMTHHIEARIGRYPLLGIKNAPLHKAVRYACGDADWTGQVAVELERRRQSAFWQIDQGDRDQ